MKHKLFPIPKETDKFIRDTIKEMAYHPLIGYRWNTDDIKISYRTNAMGLANIRIDRRDNRILKIIFNRSFVLSQPSAILRYNITHELNHLPVVNHGIEFELNMYRITGIFVPNGYTCNHPLFCRNSFNDACRIIEGVRW